MHKAVICSLEVLLLVVLTTSAETPNLENSAKELLFKPVLVSLVKRQTTSQKRSFDVSKVQNVSLDDALNWINKTGDADIMVLIVKGVSLQTRRQLIEYAKANNWANAVLADMSAAIMEELAPTSEEGISLKKCCERWLNKTDLANLQNLQYNLMLTLKEAMLAQTAPTRKKRATNTWTCTQIRQSPQIFLTATEEEIDAMNNTEFYECLADIGSLTGLQDTQRTALLNKTKVALAQTDVCLMNVTDLVNLGVIASAFSTQDLSCLPLTDSGLVASLGGIAAWTSEELRALAERYVANNSLSDLSGITAADITMLGYIMCGLTANQIANIPSSEIGTSGAIIGELSMCSTEVLTALKDKAIQPDAYGPVAEWTDADVAELKYIIVGLSDVEITSLSNASLEGLSTDVIPAIPAAVLKEMTLEQLASFSSAQAMSVTQEQKNAMSSSQLEILETQSTGGEVTLDDGGGDDTGRPTSDSIQMMSSSTVMLLIIYTAWYHIKP